MHKIFISATGIIPSPFDCFLVNRSLKTLHIRMEEHMKNGLAVAKYLESHPDVKNVLHPGMLYKFISPAMFLFTLGAFPGSGLWKDKQI